MRLKFLNDGETRIRLAAFMADRRERTINDILLRFKDLGFDVSEREAKKALTHLEQNGKLRVAYAESSRTWRME